MKYPAILKNTIGGQTVLAVSGKLFIHMSGEFEVEDSESYSFDSRYKNITTEYLANTYGEVKSKEHAHFIVELGEGAGYELAGSISPNNAGVFVFDGENKTLFFMLGGGSLRGGSVLKQIIIPLPPECESVDEWPKVGDIVTWGAKNINGEIKGIDDELAWIRNDLGNHNTVHIDELEKPKTPEQELRDELISDFRDIGQSGIVLIGMYDKVVDEFLSKYNVTKKPQ